MQGKETILILSQLSIYRSIPTKSKMFLNNWDLNMFVLNEYRANKIVQLTDIVNTKHILSRDILTEIINQQHVVLKMILII